MKLQRKNDSMSTIILFYRLVVEALKTSGPDYRAWRMHNGVLTESVVKDAIPDVENDIKGVNYVL